MSLTCPRCSEKLTKEDYGFFGAESCLYCEGVWLPGTAFSSALALTRGTHDISTLLHKVSECGHPKANLVCPTCGTNSFMSIETKGIEIDQCSQCGSIYFDKGEIERVFPELALRKPQTALGVAVATEITGDIVALLVISLFSGGC